MNVPILENHERKWVEEWVGTPPCCRGPSCPPGPSHLLWNLSHADWERMVSIQTSNISEGDFFLHLDEKIGVLTSCILGLWEVWSPLWRSPVERKERELVLMGEVVRNWGRSWMSPRALESAYSVARRLPAGAVYGAQGTRRLAQRVS